MITIHEVFDHFHVFYKSLVALIDLDRAFRAFGEIHGFSFLAVELLESFFGKDDAEGVADFTDFGLHGYVLILVKSQDFTSDGSWEWLCMQKK